MRRRWLAGRSGAVAMAVVAVLVPVGVSASVSGSAVAAADPPGPVSPAVRAASAADALVADRPEALRAGPDDRFVRQPVQSSMGWDYVPYLRTYQGLPVLGGDFVVVVNPAGDVSSTSVAQQTVIRGLDVEPAVTRETAEGVAVGELAPGVRLDEVRGSRLVVDATGATPLLAWELTVAGRGSDGPSLLEVVLDAVSGAVVRSRDQVAHDVGHSGLNGGRVEVPSVRIPCATDVPCSPIREHVLAHPAGGGMSCNARKFSVGAAPEWGDGDPTNAETACVDAMFAAGVENTMLADWLGRNGITGLQDVGGFSMFVDPEVRNNALYIGGASPEVHLGRRSTNDVWFADLDTVGHENGHGIDDHTPGGPSHHTTKEFVADAFGLATEWYANRPAPYDTPDYVVGDNPRMDLPGNLRRHMYNPSLNGTSPNCLGPDILQLAPHDAAGVGDHWLYLLAEGSNPTNGQPASPTCNGSTVSGIGLRTTMQILYHAMLMKNWNSTYVAYRSWTLTAARNLFPGDCRIINAVRRAWDAVNVPAQGGETACVPSLVGLPHHNAQQLVSASGLPLGSMTGQVNHAPVGTVISQSPAPGSLVPVNTQVSFTYSLGAVQVPHVFNRSCAEASNMIRALGLVPTCTGTGPKVTAVSPMVGSWSPAGGAVRLTLSTVRHVPDVIGVSCSTAMGWISDHDLVGQCTGSGPVVTRQSPGAGVATTVGAIVRLTMGTRPRPEPGCPDVGVTAPACP